MAEFIDDSAGLESTTIGIYRTAATVKGGRRFSFSALVVVGDRNGNVGLGYGKAPGVPAAIEKAQKAAKKRMTRITLQEGTLPHEVHGQFKASKVKLIPASPGTGVIAGATVRAVLEMAGVHDCLTKSMGSNNQINLAKATMDGLLSLLSKKQVAELRGVEIESSHVDEILEAGRRFAPASSSEKKAEAPKAKEAPKKGKGRGKGRSKPKAEKPAADAPAETGGDTATAVAEPPAPEAAPEAPAPEATDETKSE